MDAVKDFNFVSPTFVSVGTAVIPIQDFKLVADDSLISSWGDSMQVLDDGGNAVHIYNYTIADDGFDGETAGWVNEAGDDMADVNLEPGTCVLINLANNGVKIQNAGEVRTGEVVYTAGKNFNFLGNTLPCKVNIQDIRLIADDSLISSWGDSLQILDAGGNAVHIYNYTIADDGFDGETAGWVNEAGDDMADVDIEPGQGFLLNLAYAGVKVYIPGLDDVSASAE